MPDPIFPGSTVRLITKFIAQPVTYLAARVGTTDTTWTVLSTSGFPAVPFLLTAGVEVVNVSAAVGASWTVTRALEGVAQVHETGDTVIGQVLTAPTTARTLVRTPAGVTTAYTSTTAPAVSNPGTGIYELQYPVPGPTAAGAEVGIYLFWGEGTGTVPDTAKSSFVVGPGVST